jgi:cellulose biosynthesis protein BcsQ
MKSIVIFNNKGGVGKTTLLCNLSAYLQIKNKDKVIVVDADPQCNATAYLFPYPQIEEIYEKGQGTIYDVIKPVQKGKGYYNAKLPILKSPNFKVDVIPGDPKLSLSEDFLSKDWIDGKSGEYRGLQTTFVFKHLIDRLKEYNYDCVIFDVGPSLGALNRAILLSCDYFLIPMSSDIFSLRAIENISLALTEWSEGIRYGLAEYKRKEGEDFRVNNESISLNFKFIGYVTQQYTAKTVDGKKQPVNAYEKIIKRIPTTINKELSKFNSEVDSANFKLGEIPNFHSLVPLSQNASVPIFSLQAKDGVVGAHFNKVREYQNVVSTIADHLQTNIELSND